MRAGGRERNRDFVVRCWLAKDCCSCVAAAEWAFMTANGETNDMEAQTRNYNGSQRGQL